MTQKLYETDAYVQEFTATVLSCAPAQGGYAVVLDKTAFFPEGGGQPCKGEPVAAKRWHGRIWNPPLRYPEILAQFYSAPVGEHCICSRAALR